MCKKITLPLIKQNLITLRRISDGKLLLKGSSALPSSPPLPLLYYTSRLFTLDPRTVPSVWVESQQTSILVPKPSHCLVLYGLQTKECLVFFFYLTFLNCCTKIKFKRIVFLTCKIQVSVSTNEVLLAHRHAYLCMYFYGWFYVTRANLCNYDREQTAHKVKNIYHLAFYVKVCQSLVESMNVPLAPETLYDYGLCVELTVEWMNLKHMAGHKERMRL